MMERLPKGGHLLLVLLLAPWVPAYAQTPKDAMFLSTLGELREASYSDKEGIIERLGQTGHPSVRAVLTALIEGRLYFRNTDRRIFIAKSADSDPFRLSDPLTLKDAGSAPASSLSQIGTNNALRRVLRMALARFSLSSPDAGVRSDAAREISKSLDDQTAALLRERLRVETNSGVRKEIASALALAALDGSDTAARLAAVATLRDSVSQDVRNRLALLLDKSPDGSFAEKDEKVR
jgi:urea transport system permease protein